MMGDEIYRARDLLHELFRKEKWFHYTNVDFHQKYGPTLFIVVSGRHNPFVTAPKWWLDIPYNSSNRPPIHVEIDRIPGATIVVDLWLP